MASLEAAFKNPLLSDAQAEFRKSIQKPTFFTTKRALARSVAGENKNGGLITRLKNGDKEVLELDHEKDTGAISDLMYANNWISGLLSGYNYNGGFILDQINSCHPY